MKKNRILIFLLSLSLFPLSGCNSGTLYPDLKTEAFRYSQGIKQDYTAEIKYTDSYFSRSSREYNPSLATASLCMAMASFASNRADSGTDYTHRYQNIEALTSKLGFTAFQVNEDYRKQPGTDTLGATYCQKNLGDYTLIHVGIRGAGYQQEWASNFTVTDIDNSQPKYSLGFKQAADHCLEGLKDYIEDYFIDGKIKIWISGYSRAGATCNILSSLIDDAIASNTPIFGEDVHFTRDDLYSYCFEPPAGAHYQQDDVTPKNEIYDNIFNIVNPNDPVPKVVMKALGYTRFGIDKYLTDPTIDYNYSDNITKTLSHYLNVDNISALGNQYYISRFSYSSHNYVNLTQGLYLDDLLSSWAINGIGSVDAYFKQYQSGIRDLFQVIYKNGAPKASLLEVAFSFIKEILNQGEELLLDDLMYNQEYFAKDLTWMIHRSLMANNINIDLDFLLSSIKSLIHSLTVVFFESISRLLTLFSSTNLHAIISAHYPELCLSHVMAMDPNYTSEPGNYDGKGDYYFFQIDKSISDFSLYSIEGDEIVSFKDGEPAIINSNITYGIQGGEFICYLPSNHQYTTSFNKDISYTLLQYDPTSLSYQEKKPTVQSDNDKLTLSF